MRTFEEQREGVIEAGIYVQQGRGNAGQPVEVIEGFGIFRSATVTWKLGAIPKKQSFTESNANASELKALNI